MWLRTLLLREALQTQRVLAAEVEINFEVGCEKLRAPILASGRTRKEGSRITKPMTIPRQDADFALMLKALRMVV
jgi:hypothetical protein